MSSDFLKVPKTVRPVVLWVHPEGQVHGSLFVHTQSRSHAGEEDPAELLNQQDPFLIVRRDDPEELRFYQRSAIVRAEYRDAAPQADIQPFACRLYLMDGSVISGWVREALPPDRSRLIDYLNQPETRFVRVWTEDQQVCLVNKSYIIHATDLDDAPAE